MTSAVDDSVTAAEVRSQPDIWSQVLAKAPALAADFPGIGTPVLFVGCGTSYYVGEAYAARRNELGLGRTRAAIASEIPYVDPGEQLVVLSRSGTTSDVIEAVQQFRTSLPVVGLIGERETPLASLCDHVAWLDFADETSVVQTRFPTSALTLLRFSLGEDLSGLVADGRTALRLSLPDALPRHLVFLGTGWTIGVAQEAALKCREAAGAWTEAYALREYQHGPIAVAGPETLIWCFDPVPDYLRDAVAETGAAIFAPPLDPVAQLAAVHRLALRMAEAAGYDPDRPRYLSRSVQFD